jgi:DnaJ-class molecular chaperone
MSDSPKHPSRIRCRACKGAGKVKVGLKPCAVCLGLGSITREKAKALRAPTS